MEITTVEDAASTFNLDEVVFYEASAIREDDYATLLDSEAEAPDIQIDSRYRTAIDRAEYRIKVTITGPFGRVAVDASVQYKTLEGHNATPKALKEFGTQIAAPTLYPFLREAILTTGNRVGLDIKIAPFGPGDIPFH